MKTPTLLTLLLTVALALGGCSLFDNLYTEREVQATEAGTGKPIYKDAAGNETTEPTAPDGTANTPVTVRILDKAPIASGAQDFLSMFGPWGALLGGLATLGTGIYAKIRNKQRLKEAGRAHQAEGALDHAASALFFAIELIDKIKAGGPELDSDGDGKVSLAEVKAYVRDRGGRFADPGFLAEVVRIANANLSHNLKLDALKAALAAGK